MNAHRVARQRRGSAHVLVGIALTVLAHRASAQAPEPTVPIVVAQAAFLQAGPFGAPTYFTGRTPPDWPAALLPADAKIVGSAVVGDTEFFRMRTVVFEFSSQTNPKDELETMLALAGYVTPKVVGEPASEGGFVPSPPAAVATMRHCKGSTLAMYSVVDAAHSPHVFEVALLDGEAGRNSCEPERAKPTTYHFPVAVPPLAAPSGAMQIEAGSGSYGNSGGDMRSTLRTTMPVDSVLANYTTQLVAAGWKTEGRGAVGDGVGVQRFTFHDGQDNWSGALFIMAAGDRRNVRLEVSRIE